jgi:murein DD-endopeptidase MepM/ murein hydrolase activator NlpD
MFDLNRAFNSVRFIVIFALLTGLAWNSVASAQDGTEPAAEAPGPEVITGPPPDVSPPYFAEPFDISVAAVDGSGAAVLFDTPVATDDVDGAVGVACNWGSGAVFPLGTTAVICSASDSAGNSASVDFLITVTDQTAPVINWPADIYVSAPDSSGVTVSYAVPYASDNVDGAIAAGCDPGPGTFFPVGTSTVTCWASDSSGNAAASVSFAITVEAPPPPPPTVEAPPPTQAAPSPTPATTPTEQAAAGPDQASPEETATETPQATQAAPSPSTAAVKAGMTEDATETPVVTPRSTGTATSTTTLGATSTATATPSATASATATASDAGTVTPEATVPAALGLPWPYPGNFVINTYGGPLNGIDLIWGYQDYPVSQEFGHTEFSISHASWYAYGTAYGLDGYQHPGLDVGMPAGTYLYSPVEGTVRVAGGVPGYTYYGNWEPGVGQLLIVTDQGDEIVLGHMGRIAVGDGERVRVGQFVGVSGGFNGDHLHLEVREARSGGWFAAVDPRQSVIVRHIEMAGSPPEGEATEPALLAGENTSSPSEPESSVAVESGLAETAAARIPNLTPLSLAVIVERQVPTMLASVVPPQN